MVAEQYSFEYSGAPLTVTVDLAADSPTTTLPPNMRVIQGSWKTWRLEVDFTKPGLAGVKLIRSVSASGSEHPDANLTPTQSGPNGYLAMTTAIGRMYKIAAGWAAVSRFYTTEEWNAQLAAWASD